MKKAICFIAVIITLMYCTVVHAQGKSEHFMCGLTSQFHVPITLVNPKSTTVMSFHLFKDPAPVYFKITVGMMKEINAACDRQSSDDKMIVLYARKVKGNKYYYVTDYHIGDVSAYW
jgi:hypothetical protein